MTFWIFVFGTLIAAVIWMLSQAGSSAPADHAYTHMMTPPPRKKRLPPSWGDRGRQIDTRFVEVLFLERAVLLVTRLLEAAPQPVLLSSLSPYVMGEAVAVLKKRHVGVADVVGVVIGHTAIATLKQHGTAMSVDVDLHLNRHVILEDGKPRSFWSHERWSFTKEIAASLTGADDDDDLLERFGCPTCGSPVETDVHGRCSHCETTLSPGAQAWAVRAIRIHDETAIGPVLTQDVHEVGTDDATITDPAPLRDAKLILGDAERDRLHVRARELFTRLQAAWSAQDVEAIRPFETDALFQSHRCWLEEYKRQGLRNVVDDLDIDGVQTCRVARDGDFIVAILRIGAYCTDVTIDKQRRVVAGSATRTRAFTEYWTFVKHKDAQGSASLTTCPGCGAPLSISQTGICSSCDRKITLGRFDWVVSRIEQDEDVDRTSA